MGYVVAVGGVLLAILLLVVAVVDPRGFSALRGAALDATTPISSAGRGIVRAFTGTGEAISHYFMAASQNDELKRKLSTAERKLVQAAAIQYENRRLKQLLKISDELTDDVTTGRIVSSTFDSSRRLATLNVGSKSGVKVGMPVRAAEGLIGRIVETGWYASRILLITDGASNVPVRLVRSGIPAIATGRGDGTVEIKPLEVGQNPFRRGDIFVTSGTGGIFGPNIPTLIVTNVSGDETIARPLANPARADFAIVQSIYQPAANEPLQPAADAPAPAAPGRRE